MSLVGRLGEVMMPGDNVLMRPVSNWIEVCPVARHRRWNAEDEARIVAEGDAISVGEASNRNGICKTQQFT